MAQKLATPGVYIEEKNAFPNSIVGIPTAIPAFIGYTEKTVHNGQSLLNRAKRISSLTEYHIFFGEGFRSTYRIAQTENPINGYDFRVGEIGYSMIVDNTARFFFYEAIRFFFANGGGTCYITTVGNYYTAIEDDVVSTRSVAVVSKKAFGHAIDLLIGEDEPTLLVIPEAVLLEEMDCFALQQEMLQHCGLKMKNRFAILDVYNGYKSRSYDKQDVITRFREGIGSNQLAYGSAYYPYLNSTVVQNEEIDFRNIANIEELEALLIREAETTIDKKKSEEIKTEVRKLNQSDTDIERLTQTLRVISPAFKNALAKIRILQNVLPPSAAMAGIYSAIDASRGIWKAPANISIAAVISPTVKITHDDQEDLNLTVTGKSVNAIRSFIGEGTIVWGARTLDGNSQDWRYINVRRTLIFIEQSIKHAAKPYIYEANTAGTWVLIKSMIASFLNDLWKAGGLVGNNPENAYSVEVGLGATMTSNDVLEGIMRITVSVAIARPAEFIVITFQQKMQEL